MMKEFSRTLITGADGMIGSYIDFGRKTNRASLDITKLSQVTRIGREFRPKAIIHLAAETDVAKCEREPAHAYLVNSVGTYHVALLARDIGAKLLYISTNAVFDGMKGKPYTTKDTPHPADCCARTKYLGELAVRGLLENYCIIRTSSLFGGGRQKDKKFVAKIIERMNGSEIKAVEDEIISPTFAKDLVGKIKQLLAENARGIFHVVNEGFCSRFECAQEIARIRGFKGNIIPVPARSFDRIPSQIILQSSFPMRPWQEALEEYLKTEWVESIA